MLRIFGQTSALFGLAEAEKYIKELWKYVEELWQIHVTILTNISNNFDKSCANFSFVWFCDNMRERQGEATQWLDLGPNWMITGKMLLEILTIISVLFELTSENVFEQNPVILEQACYGPIFLKQS